MALEIAFGVQLSRYNSKKVLLSQTSILPLKQLRHTTTTTTDDSKLGVIVPLFSMSYMKLLIYNKPFYYNKTLVWKNTSTGDFFSPFQDII
jgi:hypothetical protein